MRLPKDKGLFLAIGFLSIGLLMLFFPYYALNGIKWLGFKISIPDYDKLGTFITGVTAPFLSISAFILLYLTYKSQKKELEDSRLILKQQSITQSKQQFETTFFNLLNLHNSIVNSIDLQITKRGFEALTATRNSQSVSQPEVKTGRDCFVAFYEGLTTAYRKEIGNTKTNSTTIDLKVELSIVEKAYGTFFEKHEYDIAHYFRNLYHIVKFVHNAHIENKQTYVSLLRAQLSSRELLLLFYNCLSEYGEKFEPFMTEYHFLKNMPIEKLLKPEHEGFYAKSAYGK